MGKKKGKPTKPTKSKGAYKKHIKLKLTPNGIPLTIIGTKDDLLTALAYYQNKQGPFYADVAAVVFNDLAPVKEDKRNASKTITDNLKIEAYIVHSFLKYLLKYPGNEKSQESLLLARAARDLCRGKNKPELHSYTVYFLTKGLTHTNRGGKKVNHLMGDSIPFNVFLENIETQEQTDVVKKYISQGKKLFSNLKYPNLTAAQATVFRYCFNSGIILKHDMKTFDHDATQFLYRVNVAVLWHLHGISEDIQQASAVARLLLDIPCPSEPSDLDDQTIWKFYRIAQTVFPIKK